MAFLPIISSTGFLIGAAVCYFSSFYLWKKQQKKELKDKEIDYLGKHFVFYGTFLFGMGIMPLLLSQNQWALRLTFPLSSIFWYVGYAFLIYVAASYKFLALQKSIFILVLMAGFAVTAVIFLNLGDSQPTIENGIILWNFQPPVSILIPLFMMTFMALAMLAFFYEALKNSDSAVKRRSLFLALSLLMGIVGGPTHALVKTAFQYFLVDMLLVVSYFLRLAGAIYKR